MSGPDWGGEQSCANCGHPASYHGVTFCQVDAGGAVKQQCDCFGWAARAAAPPVEPSKTICGKCGHPMHWIGCFAALPREVGPDGECACRNDVSELEPVPPSPVAGLREAVQAILDAHRDHERPIEPVPAPGCDPTAILIELQIALDAALHREDGA